MSESGKDGVVVGETGIGAGAGTDFFSAESPIARLCEDSVTDEGASSVAGVLGLCGCIASAGAVGLEIPTTLVAASHTKKGSRSSIPHNQSAPYGLRFVAVRSDA